MTEDEYTDWTEEVLEHKDALMFVRDEAAEEMAE